MAQEECTHGRIKQARSNAASEWRLILSAAVQLTDDEWLMLQDAHDAADNALAGHLGQPELDRVRQVHRKLLSWAMLTLRAGREEQRILRGGVAA